MINIETTIMNAIKESRKTSEQPITVAIASPGGKVYLRHYSYERCAFKWADKFLDQKNYTTGCVYLGYGSVWNFDGEWCGG